MEILLTVKVFLFILSLLKIVRDVYNFIKVIRLQQGHFENGKYGNLLFGMAFSYVITTLILGF